MSVSTTLSTMTWPFTTWPINFAWSLSPFPTWPPVPAFEFCSPNGLIFFHFFHLTTPLWSLYSLNFLTRTSPIRTSKRKFVPLNYKQSLLFAALLINGFYYSWTSKQGKNANNEGKYTYWAKFKIWNMGFAIRGSQFLRNVTPANNKGDKPLYIFCL